MNASALLDLAGTLIARPSVTPHDAGCQDLIGARLAACGFRLEKLRFGDVDNLYARHGDHDPLFLFLGHTDVVPPGALEQWQSDPFTPIVREGYLYGRGAADMKGGLAAMVIACEKFIRAYPAHAGSLAFLITSDEEGPAVNGTARVIEHLKKRGEAITWCLVGEPASEEQLGDTLKIGRRGSLSGRLIVHGKQGHVAFPEKAVNPLHRALPALDELCRRRWDEGNAHFPPTGFQISNVQAGTGATNVIPARLTLDFNFRYSTETTPEALQQQVRDILEKHRLQFELTWQPTSPPFLSPPGPLLQAAQETLRTLRGLEPRLSTAGGTSDGRFVAPTGAEVIEVGPCNTTIHQVNECVAVEDLEKLAEVYEGILSRVLCRP